MKLVCPRCSVELKVARVGVVVVETRAQFSKPEPYKLWNADLFRCPVCSKEVVANFADQPFARQGSDRDLDLAVIKASTTAPVYYDHELLPGAGDP